MNVFRLEAEYRTMGLTKLLSSKWSRRLSALSVLSEAARAFKSGNKKLAALLVGGAALAYRSSKLGFVVSLVARRLRRKK
jgi:hypothetical protein